MIDAFYAGYDTINPNDFDYVTKLDLDLDLPPRYFETLMEKMEADPRASALAAGNRFRKATPRAKPLRASSWTGRRSGFIPKNAATKTPSA